MKPYGLELSDLSGRPRCSCCTTKYHGAFPDRRASDNKTRRRRAGSKRARQAAEANIAEQQCQS